MSKYVQAITEPLIDVLNRAASSSDHRIAGYAANVDFWVHEILHCLAVIDGFQRRQELFVDAVQLAAAAIREAEISNVQRLGTVADPIELLYGEAPTSMQLENHIAHVAELRARLAESARKFLGRVRREGISVPDALQSELRKFHL
jgi:hypothetical protein